MGDDGDLNSHLYVCAASRQKAFNLINRTAYRRITLTKLDECSADSWANAMDGIANEPGVWIVRRDGDRPERIA